ncbi:Ceramide very long chain fatty acid hydroxylase [Paramicrosporidium saccamoebae]|uniref:Ceramide very long chain fatty acid hydroxylase n=1 Tax=Paramicrosporidium saccamoebae TaxID=1246581 RepID=A0A2H9TI36_9FUNG|nr:Ceramide very long chain fatty acid hydroxylase [Paramicrosporidium saccamoebae]
MPLVQRRPTYTPEEVSQHATKDDLWVHYAGKVYNVSGFAEDHPGGLEVLLEYAGQDITEAFAKLHRHSDYAQMLLEDYQIGVLKDYQGDVLKGGAAVLVKDYQDNVPLKGYQDSVLVKELPLSATMRERRDEEFLDLSKPLMPQVWANTWSKNYYLEQVHIPRYTSTTPVFFASPILEFFTKNTWYGVLIFWLPIIFLLTRYAAQSIPTVAAAHYYVDGLVLWTIYEYFFHRFVFHMDEALPERPMALVVHFLIHGVHHFLPMDRYRLVMPPLLMSAFTIPVAITLRILFDAPIAAMLLAGSLTGYVAYDMIHYYSHHGTFLPKYVQRMKTYHMDHHYVNPNQGFGVSNMIWDVVFDTMLPLRLP